MWCAKVGAACVTFVLAKGVAGLTSTTDGGTTNRGGGAAGWRDGILSRLESVAADARQDGLRYTLLARLSPVPSFVNNYGLALAGVRFGDYAAGTVIASIPPIAVHVATGAAASSVAMAAAPGAGSGGDVGGALLTALSIASAGALLQQGIARAATAAEEDREGGGRR